MAVRAQDPARGYLYAVLSMVISGVSLYVNSIAVKSFPDATLYTAMKNAVVGVALLVPLAFSGRQRGAYAALHRKEWLLLLVVAVIGGSVPYALYFRGLQVSTAVTASLIDHTQFLLVALLALVFLKERFPASVWAALGVLFAGLCVGVAVKAVRLDTGVPLLAAATVLFAVDFVVMKYLLRSVPVAVVMTFKMTLGSALLVLFVLATGSAGLVRTLTPVQWELVAVTGLILLAFTTASVLGLRHASATAVTAIPAGAPLITTAIVVLAQNVVIPPSRWVGLGLILVAVTAITVLGRRSEPRMDGP